MRRILIVLLMFLALMFTASAASLISNASITILPSGINPVLATDSDAYYTNENIVITMTNFTPNGTINLTISNGGAVYYNAIITANSMGYAVRTTTLTNVGVYVINATDLNSSISRTKIIQIISRPVKVEEKPTSKLSPCIIKCGNWSECANEKQTRICQGAGIYCSQVQRTENQTCAEQPKPAGKTAPPPAEEKKPHVELPTGIKNAITSAKSLATNFTFLWGTLLILAAIILAAFLRKRVIKK